MPLPTLAKTWQVSKNNTVPALGTSVATSKRTWRTIKDVMIGFGTMPWTVRGSSNSVAAGMDQVDRWAADSNIVWGTTNRSWIVLRQTGMGPNFEICIDLNGSFERWGTIALSFGAGFTGGAINARPTATDEFVVVSANDIHPEGDTQRQIHAWQSTDGECFRLAMCGTNGIPIWWIIEKPRNPRTGWTTPIIHMLRNSSSFVTNYTSHGDMRLAYTSGPARARFGSLNALISYTGEQASDGWLATLAPTATQQNDVDSTWDFYPIGFASNTATFRGRQGMLTDIWWAPSGLVQGDTAPNNAADRQFVKMGGLWLPWDPGGSTVPLFA